MLKPAISTRNTLGKDKRLKSRKLIGHLFEKGQSFSLYPFRVVWLQTLASDDPAEGKADAASNTPVIGSLETSSTPPAAAGRADASLQAGFTVSGKKFKRAVDRNRIKRLMRESYRLQQHALAEHLEKSGGRLALFFMYTGKEIPDQPLVHEKMGAALGRLVEKLK